MKTAQSTYPLRLPRSVKTKVERRAKREGVRINQFVATAVAEKLAVMNTAEFLAERRNRADFAAFDRLMRRRGGEKPRSGDSFARAIRDSGSRNVAVAPRAARMERRRGAHVDFARAQA